MGLFSKKENEIITNSKMEISTAEISAPIKKLEDFVKKKESEVAKEGKFINFYDITLAMIADQEEIDTIS